MSKHPAKPNATATSVDHALACIEEEWKVSSLDLQQGLEVSEEPLDTLPGDLQDVFLNR